MSMQFLLCFNCRKSLLYSLQFDRVFIFGTASLALILGALASISPSMFLAVVLVDIWLFASPHVIATYTRIGFDKTHIKKHWFLNFCLPFIVLVLVTMVALAYELSGLFTLYFIAQTYHVARQSFGISRAFRKADSQLVGHDRFSEMLIYLFPIWGLLHRCATTPVSFYGSPIHLPNVSHLVADTVGVAAVAACICW